MTDFSILLTIFQNSEHYIWLCKLYYEHIYCCFNTKCIQWTQI